VEEQGSNDCAPVLASVSACSLPGILVWDGVHTVRRFQLLFVSVSAVARVSQAYW
jgi:hypothetical protein